MMLIRYLFQNSIYLLIYLKINVNVFFFLRMMDSQRIIHFIRGTLMINNNHHTGKFSSFSFYCEFSVNKQSSNMVDILVRCVQVLHVKITRGEM